MEAVAEVKGAIEKIGSAFEEFKTKNDQRLAEIEKRGYAPADLEEQVNKIAAEVQAQAEIKERLEKIETRLARPGMADSNEPSDAKQAELKSAHCKYLRHGSDAELKLLAVDGDPQGGYWVRPEVSDRVVKKMFETSPMRNVAAVETISSDALEMTEDINEADAGWTSERVTPTETATPNIGVRRIPVHELYAMPKATQNLLDDARVDMESWLINKTSDKISRLENSAFIVGDGVGKPRGILDYPAGTGNKQIEQIVSGVADKVTADGLRDLFYALKGPYLLRAKWAMRRSTVSAVSKLKGSDNNYLWAPGLTVGEPQSLLGHEIERFEDMPAVAADSLSIAFGDFQQGYTIVDRVGVKVLRDPYSAKPFVLFYSTKRTGGDVVDFEALKIQKIAA